MEVSIPYEKKFLSSANASICITENKNSYPSDSEGKGEYKNPLCSSHNKTEFLIPTGGDFLYVSAYL